LRHTYASHAAMNGMPLQVLAHNLGHSTIKMVEKHYGHLSESYIASMIRQHAPVWGIAVESNVQPLRRPA
jgi:site-specific recombinase XerD